MKIKILKGQPNLTEGKTYDNARYNKLLESYIVKGDNHDLVSIHYANVQKIDSFTNDEQELFCEQVKDQHYKKKVEPIDLIEAFELNFNLGNVIKYVSRCEHKGNKKDDLRKALYYLNREYNDVE